MKKNNRIDNAIQEYETKHQDRGGFTVTDIADIVTDHDAELSEIAERGLKAGFAIGYRLAVRDMRG